MYTARYRAPLRFQGNERKGTRLDALVCNDGNDVAGVVKNFAEIRVAFSAARGIVASPPPPRGVLAVGGKD